MRIISTTCILQISDHYYTAVNSESSQITIPVKKENEKKETMGGKSIQGSK